MGATASVPYTSVEEALAAGKTQEEIDAWKSSQPQPTGEEAQEAPEAQEAKEAPEDPMASFWGAMFASKGPYDAQIDKFGPAPDCTNTSPAGGWYWYGQDGTSQCELAPEGDQTAAADRPCDVFYVHPTTYCGDLWNMPITDQSCRHSTEFYLTLEASSFNRTCRVFAPKFRQSVITGMGFPDEGRLATELAYSDVKKAFEHYLQNDNNGRPFILASHSQGSLYALRLMQDLIEGKPLFSQFVACYAPAAWAPLSLFQGETAIFKQIQLCTSSTDTGCFISWTCEHPDTVKQHVLNKESKEPEQWYPQMGHKVGESEWRLAHGEPIVCTSPLTWASNGMATSTTSEESGTEEEWLGMLNVLDGSNTNDMDTLNTLLYTPNATLTLSKLMKTSPDSFNAISTTKMIAAIDSKSGDLQLINFPVKIGGSSIESYEHMNFFLFWFNIRENVGVRVNAMLQ